MVITEPGVVEGMPHDTVQVVLTSGSVALIDDADMDLVGAHRWYELRGHNGKRYARTCCGNRSIYMHRLITGTPPGAETDHRNGDGLDNRRANLRVATSSQNKANKVKPTRPDGRPTSSRFKGVSWDRTRGLWQAKITVDRHCRNLGRYDDEADAARAYDLAAVLAWGEFALTNSGPVAS